MLKLTSILNVVSITIHYVDTDSPVPCITRTTHFGTIKPQLDCSKTTHWLEIYFYGANYPKMVLRKVFVLADSKSKTETTIEHSFTWKLIQQ